MISLTIDNNMDGISEENSSGALTSIELNTREYFKWMFDDKEHSILVAVYPRGAGKTYGSFDWILSRVLSDPSVQANGCILTKDLGLLKNRILDILKTKFAKYCDDGLIRMDKRNGQIDIYIRKGDTFPYRTIHTGSYFQSEGGLGLHDKYIVCDEAAEMPRFLWDLVLRPIIIQDIERGAQILLVGTPRGTKNIFYDLFAQGQEDNSLVKSVRKTCYDIKYSAQTIDFYKSTGSESSFRSELMCDFTVSSFYGSIYATTIDEIENLGLVSDDVIWNPRYPVNIAFDLGYNDATVCWFWQYYNDQVFFIDYFTVNRKYFRDIIREDIKPKYQSNYEYCILPHDAISHHHSGGGNKLDTAFDIAQAQGWHVHKLDKLAKLNGTALYPVRSFLRRVHFNKTKCADGLDALRAYSFKKQYVTDGNSEQNVICLDVPERHGEHLHACDAFRYVAYSEEIWGQRRGEFLNQRFLNQRFLNQGFLNQGLNKREDLFDI